MLMKLFLSVCILVSPVFLFAGSGEFAGNYNIKIKKSDKKDNSKKYGEALIKAVKNNDFETVKKLVYSGANINYSDGKGHCAMHYALNNGLSSEKIISFLLSGAPDLNSDKGELRKADLRLRCHFSDNAGCYMAELMVKNKMDLFKKMLDAGISPDATCYKEKVPLLTLAITSSTEKVAGSYNKKAVEYLLDKSADITKKDSKGNTPVHYAVMKDVSNLAALDIENTAIYKLAKKFGNYKTNAVLIPNNEGFTPLMLSVDRNRGDVSYKMLRFLSGFVQPCGLNEENCVLDVQETNDGRNLLMLSSVRGDIDAYCFVRTRLNSHKIPQNNNRKNNSAYANIKRYEQNNRIDCSGFVLDIIPFKK